VHFDRLGVVAPLPPDGGWRADLAVDGSASPPRAVLVARVPPAIAGDAVALSKLARGLDLTARVKHPALRPLLGTGEVDGDLVLVEAWREGAPLSVVLEAGGPLTAALVARVAVEVAGGLQACHSLTAALGPPLCHGGLSAERILLAENGEVLLCGLGRPTADGATPEDDLRQLARCLLESLAPGEGQGREPLALVLDRVLVGEGYPTAAAFSEAVAAAATPADVAAVVARVEASQPEGTPAWQAHRQAVAEAIRGPGVTTPPPLPAGAAVANRPTAPTVEPVAAPLDLEPTVDQDQFVEVIRPALPAGDSPGVSASSHLAAWAEHQRAPLVVTVALGLFGAVLGLLLGYALSAR
jgi:hypothetical protein